MNQLIKKHFENVGYKIKCMEKTVLVMNERKIP